MLFNPEDGKTREEIIDMVLGRRPDIRAELERIAASSGCSIPELVEECMGIFADELENPIKRAAWIVKMNRTMDRLQAPFGRDPLVRKAR